MPHEDGEERGAPINCINSAMCSPVMFQGKLINSCALDLPFPQPKSVLGPEQSAIAEWDTDEAEGPSEWRRRMPLHELLQGSCGSNEGVLSRDLRSAFATCVAARLHVSHIRM
jgi:hypothetical protein